MLIEETVTYLEMTAAEQLRPGRRPPAPVEMVKLDQAAAAGLRRTHTQIAWQSRPTWSDAQWAPHLARPQVHAWVPGVGEEVAGMVLAGKLPPTLFGLFMQQLRLKPLRRLPVAFGWLTKRGDAATARWLQPVLRQPAIRRDTVHVLRSISAAATSCCRPPGACPPSTGPPWSSGRSRTASCRPGTGVACRAAAAGAAGGGTRQLHAAAP
jgi:hypothetical protein